MTKTEETIQDMLSTIVGGICRKSKPEITFEHGVFNVRVAAPDQGRAVGKKGLNIWAINTLVWYAGVAQNMQQLRVKLLDPAGEPVRHPALFKALKNWDRKAITSILDKVLKICLKDHSSWSIMETGESEAMVTVNIEKYLQTPLSDPCFEDAIRVIIHAAGMSGGVVLETEVVWA